MVLKRLLEVRAAMKKKKPEFVRSDANKMFRLSRTSWRLPRGRDNKIRRRIKGRMPHPGYGVPKEVRGLNSTGLEEIIVRNVAGLEGLGPEKHLVRIGGTVGLKKRLDIVEEAGKKKLRVLNAGLSVIRINKAKKRKEKLKEAKKEEKHEPAEAKKEKEGKDHKPKHEEKAGKENPAEKKK